MSILTNYPGSKNNSGILQFFINRIPYHMRYYELFAGSAALYCNKRPAQYNVLMDIYPPVIDELRMMPHTGKTFCWHGNALRYLQQLHITREDFIYLDPPYPASSRRSSRALYKHELLADDDHVQLLTTVRTMDANIMISTKPNALYDKYLKSWRKEEFHTRDRAGNYYEVIYMNYPPPTILHQYDYLGDDYVKRQNMTRKRQRFMHKLQQLSTYEQHMYIQAIIAADRAAVQHFLTVSATTGSNTDAIRSLQPKPPVPPGRKAAIADTAGNTANSTCVISPRSTTADTGTNNYPCRKRQ